MYQEVVQFNGQSLLVNFDYEYIDGDSYSIFIEEAVVISDDGDEVPYDWQSVEEELQDAVAEVLRIKELEPEDYELEE